MEEEVTRVGQPVEDQSLFDRLAEARRESAENRETFITIPGYEDSGIELLARYRLMSGPEIEAIAKRITSKGNKGKRQRGFDQGLAAALDTMAAACTGVFIQRDEDEEPRPLTVGGEPVVNYGDPKLRSALQIGDDADTTRKVILATFCDNELAVVSHSAKLQRWFGNTNARVDEDFLGEA